MDRINRIDKLNQINGYDKLYKPNKLKKSKNSKIILILQREEPIMLFAPYTVPSPYDASVELVWGTDDALILEKKLIELLKIYPHTKLFPVESMDWLIDVVMGEFVSSEKEEITKGVGVKNEHGIKIERKNVDSKDIGSYRNGNPNPLRK